MPLVANSDLPAFARLAQEGETVLTRETALHQDIRELHIGLLNMMPDAALAATERQFFRLIGESNQIAQFFVHPFTFPELKRSAEGQAHVDRHYETFDAIREQGLDALIISGANVTQPDLALEPFWEPLIEVIAWAHDNVTSTLCSCLASHAVLQFRYDLTRRHLEQKRWGVFPHRVVDRDHPLVMGVNTRFDVPHSRFNQVDQDQFEKAGLKVLASGEEAGVHLAVSEDGFRIVFFQGHPEYDSISLLKEYKREVNLYAAGKRDEYPPFPSNYFSPKCQAMLDEYREQVDSAIAQGYALPALPEALLMERLDNTWHDTGEAILNNWIGKVYQTTNKDRQLQFMDGIDPNDPLGLKKP